MVEDTPGRESAVKITLGAGNEPDCGIETPSRCIPPSVVPLRIEEILQTCRHRQNHGAMRASLNQFCCPQRLTALRFFSQADDR